MTWQVIEADCVEAMKEMDEASVDAVVTDPPYGLEFMGRTWDKLWREQDEQRPGYVGSDGAKRNSAFSQHFERPQYQAGQAAQTWHQAWATEALRVLKPGGHLLAFGGTRTYHRLACAVEDAGFEIRDSVIWLYGSGFPKSLDVSKAMDRAAGAEREVVGEVKSPFKVDKAEADRTAYGAYEAGIGEDGYRSSTITAPATPEAQRWQGWGTALKPAHEPIVVARKPLIGTVSRNVSEFGTGALNIAATRIGTGDNLDGGRYSEHGEGEADGATYGSGINERTPGGYEQPSGRWPANVALSHLESCQRVGERRVKPVGATAHRKEHGNDEALIRNGRNDHPGYRDADGLETVEAWSCAPGCSVAELDRQSGETTGPTRRFSPRGARPFAEADGFGGVSDFDYGDTGGASRFFATFQADADVGGDLASPGGDGHPHTADVSARFFYVAKASRAERGAGLDGSAHGDSKIGVCRCPRNQGDTEPPRATDVGIVAAGCDSSTTGSGSKSTARSPKASKSTTSTATRKTTGSTTSPSSPRPSTSESTPPTSDAPETDGSADAQSAASGSPPTPNTSTSASGDGSSTDDADRATSRESSRTSSSVGSGRTCPDCGGVVQGALRNSHPT